MAKSKGKYKFGSEEQKQAWIAEVIEKKNAERKKKFMKSGVFGVDCRCGTCYHRASESCPGLGSSEVCKYWYRPDAPVIGTAYCIEGIGSAKSKAKRTIK